MRVVFGADELTPTTEGILGWLAERGHEVLLAGEGEEWPEIGNLVGRAVAEGSADVGVVCCWTGTGVSIAANKVPGARAALCPAAETARGARRWNDANVVALSLRLVSPHVAEEILEAFLSTGADPEELAAVERIERIEG